ncbi:putative diphosphomevalonate decarboxylase [Gongronella butleri]|nr:putative diphosphomevalonate decarboxylase [Gongronella butleri]
MASVTCTAPVNIAVIKYWGKTNTDLILPTNDSLSVTLSQDILHSKTSISTQASFEQDRLWLNGIEEDITKNKRMHNCFRETRALRKAMEEADASLEKLSTYGVHVCSENNFPTAAGLASSASGLAALVFALAKLYQLPIDMSDLSRIARQGSGSACRSLFGGFVAWEKGELADGSDSRAVQIAPDTHWPELEALVCVVSDKKKGTSSTAGMQQTVESSPLMQERLRVVPARMKAMSDAILARDFQKFAEITMRDSNQFHAVCLDTFPPIFYLNDTSRGIIQLIHAYNKAHGEYKAAYTYDAGPNAVIYAPKENMKEIIQLIHHYFPKGTDTPKDTYFADPYGLFQANAAEFDQEPKVNPAVIPIYPPGSVSRLLHTKVHDGPRVLDEAESLLNDQGLPKRVA